MPNRRTATATPVPTPTPTGTELTKTDKEDLATARFAAVPQKSTAATGTREKDTSKEGKRKRRSGSPFSYYDVPMLQPPVWKWEIATYFFLGGLSAGAYMLARVAARFGGKRYKDVTNAGTAIAAAAFVPCAPLLIHDLGDRMRFLYMLRVFKPQSPMNLGSWVLTGYSATLSLAAINQWRKASKEGQALSATLPEPLVQVADGVVETVIDGAGLPLAILLAGYTGVLLSTTATPIWARNPWLGALFSASAVASGAEAIDLALQIASPHAEESPACRPIRQIAQVAKAAEAVAMVGYLNEAGNHAKPITEGKYANWHRYGAIGLGLVVSTACALAPIKNPKTRRALRIGGAIAGLAGGFALRWALTQGGRESPSSELSNKSDKDNSDSK